MELPERYLEAMRLLLGEEEFDNYKKSMEETGFRGLRINPLKVEKEKQEAVLKAVCSSVTEMVLWSGGLGFYYDEEASPARHPYYFGGMYYLQEPSAMAPAAFLSVKPGDRVLDLCAAPGGKSTQLGAGLSGQGLLVSNDVSASRAKGLLKNLELFGIGNCLVSAEEPERLLVSFPGYFDKVLVDAPCSGEGMFRRESSMAESWKERGPEYYSPIQKRLLLTACKMVKPGGFVLYSTCTFSKEEDEDTVSRVLAEAPDMEQVKLLPVDGISQGFDGFSLRLFPWRLKGEGHFVSLLRKKSGDASTISEGGETSSDMAARRKSNEVFLKKQEAFAAFRRLIKAPLEERGYYWEREGKLYLLPVPPAELPGIRFLRTGLLLGSVIKNRFEPSQALAMYLKKEEFANTVDFASEDIRTVKYLKGETVDCTEESEEGKRRSPVVSGSDGWCLVCSDGWPLGFAKKSRRTLKNKYYPGWRWQ